MSALIEPASIVRRRQNGRVDERISVDDEVSQALREGAAVALGVSGGKDSAAMALATVRFLDEIEHQGPRVLIHSDLGRVEWAASGPMCESIAERTGLELVTVRRKAGDMLTRWQTRWHNNVERYADLECVRLILPWSTPSMRFCTSELKTSVICADLVKRFPGKRILSASGIRRDESSKRRLAPVSKANKKLASRRHQTSGLDWHPILGWLTADVYAFLHAQAFPLHEAYTVYDATRVSCRFCIMSSEHDLVASTTCPDNAGHYRDLVDLEIVSTFGFQSSVWLGDVAPHLLTEEQRAGLAGAKERAKRREAAEARIPEDLLYVEGWPHRVPTYDEAAILAEVRIEVADAVGIAESIGYILPATIIARYEELMAAKPVVA